MGSLGNRSMSSALYRRYLSINGSRTSPDRYKVMHSFSFPIYADIKLVDLIFPSFFLAIFQMDAWQHVLRTGFRVDVSSRCWLRRILQRHYSIYRQEHKSRLVVVY